MPNRGFKSITMRDKVYDYFEARYKEQKTNLHENGINSLSGFIVSAVEFILRRDKIFAKYAPVFEKRAITKNEVMIYDNITEETIVLKRNKDELFCTKCNRDNCYHVGFCYSLHGVYPI